MKKRIMVSSCLLGYNCNYKGCCDKEYAKRQSFWNELFDRYEVVPFCPEQLGGMTTPRTPSELLGSAKDVYDGRSKVVSKTGEDVTACFVKGSNEVLRVAELLKPEFIVLKSKSPSCGTGMIYDGTFSGKLVKGFGMAAWLLKENGFSVIDESSEF